MRFIVGASFSLLVFVILIAACRIIGFNFSNIHFLAGWLCCTAYCIGENYSAKTIDCFKKKKKISTKIVAE